MAISNALKPFLFIVALLYSAVSGVGMATGTMAMSEAQTCTMTGYQFRMCPMSAADHLASWQSTFRAVVKRPFDLTIVIVAAVASSFLILTDQVRKLPLRWRKWSGPPAWMPLFISLIGGGMHQRVTYG